MKLLTLIRHAKSSWKEPVLPDLQRPLNSRGYRDAPMIGEILREDGVVPDLVISSPAKRAITTARIIAGAIAVPPEAIVEDPRVYEATVATLYTVVREVDDRCCHLCLFGHNPGFQWFANDLAEFVTDKLVTCGVVRLELPVSNWRDVEAGQAVLICYLSPKMFRKG